MSELPFAQQAALWGQAFEVLVKRGVLACLVERKLVARADPRLAAWRDTRLLQVTAALTRELDVIEESARDVVNAAVDHLALSGYGLGYTAMREYLKPLEKYLARSALCVRGLYCPLTLPGGAGNSDDERARDRRAFASALGVSGAPDASLTDKGMPARADFLLWLSGDAREDHLLVQEYSFDMPAELGDFRKEAAHLDELLRHRRLVDSRGVFARVAAEVDGEHFQLSQDISNHLVALTGENKPLYKLCQASAYAMSTVRVLSSAGLLAKPCMARALAITPNGLESIAARFDITGAKEPRRLLMEQMGIAYRRAAKLLDGDDEGLLRKATEVFNGVLRRLPGPLQRGMKALRNAPAAGQDFEFEFTEQMRDFANPMQRYSFDSALRLVDESPALAEYFGRPAREAIAGPLRELVPSGEVPLRDLHAAAVVAALRAAKPAQLNVLALEGNPGIGKTTAVTRYLGQQQSGYLFLYVSPRVVINRDVTDKMARIDGKPSGTLTLTTNAQLIASAERWYRAQVDAGTASKRRVESALVADGVANLRRPEGSTLVITPDQEQDIEARHAGSRLSKTTLSEHEDLVQERSLPGVLSTIAGATRELLALNPQVERVVLTAALQGFREKTGGKTTMDALSALFRNPASRDAGVRERRQFAQKHPTIIVMVDELAGDGAGAPFVHAVARWLSNEFIECFEDEPSPFTVSLVVSDASLANEVVLDRYLNAGERTPDKVLISASRGARPFRLCANQLRVGGARRPTLHVMTNSFPASELHLRYRVKMTDVPLVPLDGALPNARKAIREAAGESLIESAAAEILAALDHGAAQVIYFAQDKLFLSELRNRLTKETQHALDVHNVEVLDSSVPGWKRKKLVEPEHRDEVRVFLMTSSGARGVSFPKTDWIIAAVPRFNVEAALMEISQLVYRGRGQYRDEVGDSISGDHVCRHLVMLVDDFLVHDEALDPRQWLRQALDLLTLLVMLRSTLFTRIMGDSGLRQPIAFVPVGAVGLEELVSVMSQYVNRFIEEAEVYLRRSSDKERNGLVANAKANVSELFANPRLKAIARRGVDGRSLTKSDDVARLLTSTTTAIPSLLAEPGGASSIPDHIFFTGPLVFENWEQFDKQEAFSFEGHETQDFKRGRQLFAQLRRIDEDPAFPAALRVPASNLLRLLARKKPDAANEFNTLKDLKSPNTWVVLPAGYAQFVDAAAADAGRVFRLEEPEAWRDALARSLAAGSAVLPAIPRYQSFPWAAAVGRTDPLKLEQVFDDRYFLASHEFNFLNSLLLADQADEDSIAASAGVSLSVSADIESG